MLSNCNISEPITLNCWKHHIGFIKNQIRKGKKENPSAERLKKIMLIIGESQMDIYLGRLTPKRISDEIIDYLKKMNAYTFPKYNNWLKSEGKDYKLLTISDNSVWTVRPGKNETRYVHIHPGRYSINTIRVKALTLKTAIAASILSKSSENINIELINSIRKEILDAPPLKSFNPNSGLGKFLSILNYGTVH